MKTSKLLLIGAALTLGIVGGCKKDDTTPPTITLTGSNPFSLALNSNYVDPGATASDDEDGDGLTVSVDASDINKDLVGSYTVAYSATDAAGNEGTATRTVNVANQLTTSAWTGTYSCVITTSGQPPYNYTDANVISTTLNNGLAWNKFGDYSNATAKLSMIVNSGGSVTIPTQSFNCGTPAVLRKFTGSGISNGSGGAGSTITLQIDETVNNVTTSFTYLFTKQ